LALWLDEEDCHGPDPAHIDSVPVYAHVKVGEQYAGIDTLL